MWEREDEFVAFVIVADEERGGPGALELFEVFAGGLGEFCFPDRFAGGFVEGEEIGFRAGAGV